MKNKKTIKKIISLFVVLLLVAIPFSFLINVKAVTIDFDNNTSGTTDVNSKKITNTATLTLQGVKPEDEFTSYKILDAFYNADTNVITYEFTSDFKTFLAQDNDYKNLTVNQYYNLTSGTSNSTQTESTLDKLVSRYTTYIRNNSIDGEMTMKAVTTEVAGTVTAGTYLVLPTTPFTTSVYAVMVGNADFKAVGTDWEINNPTIVAKVSDVGDFSKELASHMTNVTEGTFSFNEEYTTIIKAAVPKYPTNSTNRTYIFKEKLSDVVTFSGITNISIKDGTTALTVRADGTVVNGSGEQVASITFEETKNEVTIDFNHIELITSNNIEITYKAKLNGNESTVIGGTGNLSGTTTFTYATDPYNANSTHTAPVQTTAVFTYGIELKNMGSEDGNPTLVGGVFEVYSDEDLVNKIGEITVGANGIGLYTGIKQNVYYLKQIKAPAGYSLNTTTHSVKVALTDAQESEENLGHYTITVLNTKAGILPSTGGVGTIIYTLIGLLIVIIGATAIVSYRKKKYASSK